MGVLVQRRHATASRYLGDFGVAMYCGFGRQPGVDGMETHARAPAGGPLAPRRRDLTTFEVRLRVSARSRETADAR